MKPEFLTIPTHAITRRDPKRWSVRSESDALSEVLLCGPAYLAPVPCCSVTRDSLGDGHQTDTAKALAQHRQLQALLEQLGTRCHVLDPLPDLPDLCFTRDCAVATPWGPVLLNPAVAHRRREVDHVARYLGNRGGGPLLRIEGGTVEGGDVCVARDGLAIIGWSGERTSLAGAQILGEVFRGHGWEVLLCPFDAYHLHLDTIFCMLDAHFALACIDALPEAFLSALAARGIRVLPALEAESRKLGCNILSLDGSTILIAEGQHRLHAMLLQAGFKPLPVDISEFAACGGGLHCLTMPLARG
ncbi:dimethylarginine dimethylaminohydrolase family protein [Sphingomonas sp. OTU376]|uniref:dimethylarginine dimethylaminohydrolase family protein n=1 Tax=Sphingomonas sp. OTU376 TaxID=3043863 RepID=UPI00313BDB3E